MCAFPQSRGLETVRFFNEFSKEILFFGFAEAVPTSCQSLERLTGKVDILT